MSIANIADIIGIMGVVLILVAYFLLQIGRAKSDSLNYSLINLIGSVMILFSLLFHWNLASVIIEFAWILISLYGIWRWIKKQS